MADEPITSPKPRVEPSPTRLFQDSGSEPADRAKEAWDIIIEHKLGEVTDRMQPNEAGFVEELAERLSTYQMATHVSPKQLWWLRDLLEKYT